MTAPEASDAAARTAAPARETCVFRLGSLTIRLRSGSTGLVPFLADYYRLVPMREEILAREHLDVDVELAIELVPEPSGHAREPGDGPVVTRRGERPGDATISSPLVRAALTSLPGGVGLEVSVLVDRDTLSDRARYELFLTLNRAWRLLGRLQLHAAAVRLDERTYVFAGDKGAGKSSLCLALARAGGTVLAEDHVLLTRREDGYTISGSDGVLRLGSDVERHFFEQPLDAPVKDLQGVVKKEVPLGSVVRCAAYRDYPVDALLLPSVDRSGGADRAITIERVPKRAALIHFLGALRWRHRFADASEQREYLDYLTAFVESAPVFGLRLGALNQLDRLGGLLKSCDLDARV